MLFACELLLPPCLPLVASSCCCCLCSCSSVSPSFDLATSVDRVSALGERRNSQSTPSSLTFSARLIRFFDLAVAAVLCLQQRAATQMKKCGIDPDRDLEEAVASLAAAVQVVVKGRSRADSDYQSGGGATARTPIQAARTILLILDAIYRQPYHFSRRRRNVVQDAGTTVTAPDLQSALEDSGVRYFDIDTACSLVVLSSPADSTFYIEDGLMEAALVLADCTVDEAAAEIKGLLVRKSMKVSSTALQCWAAMLKGEPTGRSEGDGELETALKVLPDKGWLGRWRSNGYRPVSLTSPVNRTDGALYLTLGGDAKYWKNHRMTKPPKQLRSFAETMEEFGRRNDT